MKKHLILSLTLTIAMTAFALPDATRRKLSAPAANTERVTQEKRHRQHDKNSGVNALLAQIEAERATIPALKTPAKTAEVKNISFNDVVGEALTYKESYSGWTGKYFLSFNDGSDDPKNYIALYIKHDNSPLRGVYTSKDCDLTYSSCSIEKESIAQTFDSVYISFTPTRQGFQIEGKFYINDVACITVSYLKRQLMPKDTIDIAIPNATLDIQAKSYKVQGMTADNKYTVSAMVLDSTFFYNHPAEQLDSAMTFVVMNEGATMTKSHVLDKKASLYASVKDDNYLIDFNMIGTDSVMYNVQFTSPLPKITDTVDVKLGNLNIDASLIDWGLNSVIISASSNDYTLSIWLKSDKYPNGNYTVDDFTSSFLSIDSKIVGFLSGSITIDAAANTLTGLLLGDDLRYYRMDLKFEKPIAKDTIVTTFDNVKPLKYDSQTQDYYVYYSNTQIGVQIDFYAEKDSPVGTYSYLEDKKISYQYTFVDKFNGGDTTMIGILDATIIVSATGTDTLFNIEASLLCEDSIFYIFTFQSSYTYKEWLDFDTEKEDLSKTYTSEDYVFFFAHDLEKESVIYLQAIAKDDGRILDMTFNVAETVIQKDTMPAAGVYPIDLTKQAGTVTASSGVVGRSVTGSYTGLLNPSYEIQPQGLYFLVSGTVTVTYDTNNNVKVVVAAKNSYDRNIDIIYDSAATDVRNVQIDTVQTKKILRNGHVLIVRDDKTYTLMGVEVK